LIIESVNVTLSADLWQRKSPPALMIAGTIAVAKVAFAIPQMAISGQELLKF
jgi:hypothetical protein